MWRLAIVAMLAGAALAACGGGGLSDQEEFARRIERLREGTFTVTFDYELEQPEGDRIATRTWHHEPNGDRTDSVGDFGTWTFIRAEENGYQCSDLIADPAGAHCELMARVTANVDRLGPVPGMLMQDYRLEDFAVAEANDREIADTKAKCFLLERVTDEFTIRQEYCLSKEGLPLAWHYPPEGEPPIQPRTVVMVATEVKNEVADGVFAPPYEITVIDPRCEYGFEC